MPELGCDVTPDGTYIFEMTRADGARVVVTVFPEDVDEIAGPASEPPLGSEEKQRRYRVARLLAETELANQGEGDGEGRGEAREPR